LLDLLEQVADVLDEADYKASKALEGQDRNQRRLGYGLQHFNWFWCWS